MARWAGLATVSLSTTAARVASVTSPKRWSSEPSRIFAQRSLSSAQPRAASLCPVGLLVGRGQEGLALGDAQRVGRDPGVKLQDRVGGIPGTDLGGEEVADGVEERRARTDDHGAERAGTRGPEGDRAPVSGWRGPGRAARRTPARRRGGPAPRARPRARRRTGTVRPGCGRAAPSAPCRTAPTSAGSPRPAGCRRPRRSRPSGLPGCRTRRRGSASRTATPWCTASPGPAAGRRGG